MADTISSTTATTATLVVGTSSSSYIDYYRDTDWWRVTLVAGWGYYIDLKGWDSLNGTLFDPWLGVANAAGTAYLATNDDGGYGLDSYIYFVPASTDTYFLVAQESSFLGVTDTGSYRISLYHDLLASIATAASIAVGTAVWSTIDVDGDADWIAVTLVAGETYLFDLKGSATGSRTLVDPWLGVANSAGQRLKSNDDSGIGLNSRIIFTASSSGTYYLQAYDANNVGIGTYTLATTNINAVATALAVGGSASGNLSSADETDIFSVTASSGTLITVSFDAPSGISGSPFEIQVLDQTGEKIAAWATGSDFSFNVGSPTGGTAYITVSPGSSYSAGQYGITVTAESLDYSTAPTSTIKPLTGDAVVDATTHGYYWALNAPRVITWAIADSGSSYWIDPQAAITGIQAILSNFEAVADLHFKGLGYYSSVAAADALGADIVISLDGANERFSSSSQWAMAFFPSTSGTYNPYPGAAGDVWINVNSAANTLSYAPSSAGYFLALHEFGHALGLKHPHDDGGTGHPTYSQAGIRTLNTDWATVMSYSDDFSWNLKAWDPATLMPLDLIGMQSIYGANTSNHSGNDTYSLTADDYYKTIWDAGGSDVVSMAASSQGWIIWLPSLQLAQSSNVLTGAAYLASEVQLSSPHTLYWLMGDIENATGSGYDDVISGNHLANVLNGAAGNDRIGGAGGSDSLTGGAGNDVFYFAAAGDSTLTSLDTVADLQAGDKIELTGVAGISQHSVVFGYATSVAATVTAIQNNSNVTNRAVFFTDTTDGYLYVKGAGTGTSFDGSLIKLTGQGAAPSLAQLLGITAPVNSAPVLAIPSAPTFNDTSGNDSFVVANGILSASDPEGTALTYSLTGGSLSGGISTLAGSYGTLAVTVATGAWTYTPNDAAIEALYGNASDSFTVGTSDGQLSASQAFTVSLVGSYDVPVITSKYFVLAGAGANYIDYKLNAGSLNLQGQYISQAGTTGVDAIHIRPGTTIDFTLSGASADKIYFDGNRGDYSSYLAGSIMTLIRGSGASQEVVRVTKSTTNLSSDLLVFANGSVNTLDLYNLLKNGTSLPTLGTETSLTPLAPAASGSTLSANIKAFSVDSTGETFAPVRHGINLTTVGSIGVDTLYVGNGSTVDATLLGSSSDLLYLRGTWGDYAKSVAGSIITFTRTIDGDLETVKVVGGAGALNDKLIFADGAVMSSNAKAALNGNINVALNTIAGYDPATTTPGLLTVSSVGINTDSGSSATDFVTNTAAQTITGTLSGALAAGDILYGSVNNGSSWIDITNKVSGTAISWNGATLSGSSNIMFKVRDAAGNDGAATGRNAYTLDTLAPSYSSTATATAISENSGANQVIYTASASDTGAIVYSLKSGTADASAFSINGSTGAVTLTGNPDFEAKPSYGFTVVATDVAGNASERAVTLSVTNVNEAPAITSGQLTTSFAEILDASATTATAYSLLPGQTVQGALTGTGDVDWYKVYLTAGQQYSFAMTGTGVSNVQNPLLHLYNASSVSLTSNDNGLPGGNSVFSYTPNASGYYYIGAKAATAADAGTYGLTFTSGSRPSFDVGMGGGVIDTDYSWSGAGAPVNVTYGFRQSWASAYTSATHDLSTFSQLTAAQITAVRSCLQAWADVCGITFTEVSPGGYTNDATMLISNYLDAGDGAGAFAFYPTTANTSLDSIQGDVWLNLNSISTTTLPAGSGNFSTIIHEIGHAIGLSHPGTYNAAAGVSITYQADAKFVQDSRQYSRMSYFDESYTSAQFAFGQYSRTPMMFDILAAQSIYGANTSTRTSDTVYGFNSTAGAAYLFDTALNATPAFCIWDAGGTDTIDASGYSQNQLLNLCAATFSDVGGSIKNISIALGATIENAKGGSGNDVIFGNAANNTLTGGAGDDALFGGAGSDTAVFSGTRAQYTVSSMTDGWSVVGADGTDQLFNIEQAQFSDQTLKLAENASRVTTSYVTVDFRENGTGAVYTAAASDVDAGTILTYSLSGADAGLFNINSATGAVTFKVAPDYETPTDVGANNVYTVAVTASDGVNVSDAQAVAITVMNGEAGDATIDLGIYGKLIAPVQVDGGKWYYYWDYSGNGLVSDADAVNHDIVDAIFNQDINGVTNTTVLNADGLYGTTDIYRYATINGVHLALPTVGGVTSSPYGANGIGQYQPGTNVGASIAANGSNSANSTYNDLLAIWDAYNGTGLGTNINGAPTGWQSPLSYWSATPTLSLGHAAVGLGTGVVYDFSDRSTERYVTLQVLPG